MVTDPRALRFLQTELRRAAAELAERTPRRVVRDDLSTTVHEAPSLLAQLRDAVGASGETGKGGGRRGVPSPADEAALDLLTGIERDLAALHLQTMRREPVTAEERIRAMVAAAGRWISADDVAWLLGRLHDVASEIRGFLDPPRHLEVAAACPACDTRMVWRHRDGEDVQVPALTVDGTVGCTCLACGHIWPPANLEFLAGLLGCEPLTPGDHGAA